MTSIFLVVLGYYHGPKFNDSMWSTRAKAEARVSELVVLGCHADCMSIEEWFVDTKGAARLP